MAVNVVVLLQCLSHICLWIISQLILMTRTGMFEHHFFRTCHGKSSRSKILSHTSHVAVIREKKSFSDIHDNFHNIFWENLPKKSARYFTILYFETPETPFSHPLSFSFKPPFKLPYKSMLCFTFLTFSPSPYVRRH